MDSKKVIVDSELREARGYLMDVISHALSQMNGHVEIEHTELPSVPMKGDFWKEEGGNVFMELIKGEHNIKDAMFHDVHAEKYSLDEVINKLDYSETYALTIAVREAQIKDIVSSFDGQEIYFDEPVAVSRDDNDIEKDYVAGVKIDDDGSLNISGHRVDDDGETHVFYHADDLYLNGYDDLLAKLSEMRQQENIKEEHFLEPLTDEQWKVMSEIGYPYAPGNAKEHEAAPVPDMIYWRLAAGMMTKDDAVRAFSTTGYIIGRDPERTNEILAELNIMYQKLDNDFKPLTAGDKQEHVNDEFLNYVVYGERRYPIYQNMENRLNIFMKNSGVDIPLSHILYGENTKVNRWNDLHQIVSRTVESILRESGQGDEKLLNSTTTDYISDKAKTLALDIVRSIRVDEVNYEARRKEALKDIGYPYLKHTTNADGSFNIPTVDESLYWEYAAGVISLKDAAREFNRSGWTNFVDEKYTKAKFAQLNGQYGKLDADLKPIVIQPVSDIDKLKAILDENFLNGEEVGKRIYFTQPIPFKNEAGSWQAVGVHCGTKNYEIEDNEGNKIPYDIFGRYDKVAAAVKEAVEAPKEIQEYSLRIGSNDYNLSVSSMDGREGFVAMFGVPGNYDLVDLLEDPTVMDADVSRLFLICKDNNDAAGRKQFAEAVVLRHFGDLTHNIHQQESIVAGYREAGLLGKPIDLVKPIVYETQMSDKVAEVNDNGHYISIELYKDLEDANEHLEPTFFMDEGVKDYRQAMYDSLKETLNVHLEQSAKQAIRDRITNSWQRTFTPNQVDVLNRYHQIATSEIPVREVFSRLLHEVSQEPDVAQKSEKWITDTAKELDEVAKGNTCEEVQGLKR